jgi:hypothetical protein
MSQIVFNAKTGVLFGLLRHPSIMQQVQQLPPDEVISIVILLTIAVKLGTMAIEALSGRVESTSLWRGLVDLAISAFEPSVSFLTMIIGDLLVRAILHYTNEEFIGSVITFAISVVVDAIMNYRSPKLTKSAA